MDAVLHQLQQADSMRSLLAGMGLPSMAAQVAAMESSLADNEGRLNDALAAVDGFLAAYPTGGAPAGVWSAVVG